MIIKKRNGQPQPYCWDKIKQAVALAFASVEEPVDEHTLEEILQKVESRFPSASGGDYSLTVEEIQDLVENRLMAAGAYTVAHNYITYRYERALVRKANTTDKKILSLLGNTNEEAKQENSNKNPTVNSTQQLYIGCAK